MAHVSMRFYKAGFRPLVYLSIMTVAVEFKDETRQPCPLLGKGIMTGSGQGKLFTSCPGATIEHHVATQAITNLPNQGGCMHANQITKME